MEEKKKMLGSFQKVKVIRACLFTVLKVTRTTQDFTYRAYRARLGWVWRGLTKPHGLCQKSWKTKNQSNNA